jgi:nucleoside-diphosphate-sugar epimerase
VVRGLLKAGHEVVGADRQPPPVEEGDRHRTVDLTDVGQVAGAMAGCEAVVHLGAIPGPDMYPDEVVFTNNTLSTFAVLQAASLLGVSRAVVASSGSALGMAWAPRPFPPLYVPVDEDHPLLAQDPYGLSKEVDERTCAMFNRRTGISVLAYRFHWITLPEEAAGRAATLRDRAGEDARELWGYVDVRDAARACRLGLESKGLDFEVFNIAAADTLSESPTEELVQTHLPNVEIRRRIEATGSAWSTEKARKLLGYVPQHSWRENT